MMRSSLTIFARRAALVASKRAGPPCVTFLKGMSTQVKKTDVQGMPEFDGHLTHEQMLALNQLFSNKIDKLESDVAELKQIIEDNKRTVAVDAPDGEADAHTQEDLQEFVKGVIDGAAAHEDTAAINARHQAEEETIAANKRTLAVDGPDGEADAHTQEDLQEFVKGVIDGAAAHEDATAINAKHQLEEEIIAATKRIMAVDGPDGEPDGQTLEELEKLKLIIDAAAAHEDKAKIDDMHKKQDDVRKFHARDQEHDW